MTIPLAPAGREELAFEPSGRALEMLHRNVVLNGLPDRVEVRGVAVTADGGRQGMRVPEQDLGSGRLVQGDEIDSVRVDDAIAGRAVGLLKIDVEGAEMDVLRSAEQTIADQHPVLVIEAAAAQLARYGATLEQMEVFLRSFGYRLYVPLGARNIASDQWRIGVLPSMRWLEGHITDVIAISPQMEPTVGCGWCHGAWRSGISAIC